MLHIKLAAYLQSIAILGDIVEVFGGFVAKGKHKGLGRRFYGKIGRYVNGYGMHQSGGVIKLYRIRPCFGGKGVIGFGFKKQGRKEDKLAGAFGIIG